MLHTLLLNFTYEPIAFIPEKRIFKLLIKEKIEVISDWDLKIKWVNSNIPHPAVVRLKHHVRWIPKMKNFSPYSLFRRDRYVCQYCGEALSPSRSTIDHVVPTSQGGETSWRNCVTACFYCNNKKANRTPSEAGMKLIARPVMTGCNLYSEFLLIKKKHQDWEKFINY